VGGGKGGGVGEWGGGGVRDEGGVSQSVWGQKVGRGGRGVFKLDQGAEEEWSGVIKEGSCRKVSRGFSLNDSTLTKLNRRTNTDDPIVPCEGCFVRAAWGSAGARVKRRKERRPEIHIKVGGGNICAGSKGGTARGKRGGENISRY